MGGRALVSGTLPTRDRPDIDSRDMLPLRTQAAVLFLLALPVACVAWTVTHEEIFREPRQYCVERSRTCRRLVARKFFYLFTCEYSFSHYVAALTLWITRYQLLYADWRGYVLALFALVWVANVYMSAFGRLRLDIREERLEIEQREQEVRGPGGSGASGDAPVAAGRSTPPRPPDAHG